MFDRARQLSPSQALAVGLDACRALDYAHRRGFVHSELTPSKLVFGDDRRLRITDFGLARLLNAEAWKQPDSVATHTAWYASPEQGLSQPIDGKTDVYALCLTLQEAVTGVLPFRNDSTVASLAARVGRLMPVSADLGPLAAVLEHAGRPEADERASAAEFGKDLVQAAGKLPRPAPAAAVVDRAVRDPGRSTQESGRSDRWRRPAAGRATGFGARHPGDRRGRTRGSGQSHRPSCRPLHRSTTSSSCRSTRRSVIGPRIVIPMPSSRRRPLRSSPARSPTPIRHRARPNPPRVTPMRFGSPRTPRPSRPRRPATIRRKHPPRRSCPPSRPNPRVGDGACPGRSCCR